MAIHSSSLAWKIPWTKEPGSLQSMGSLIVGHDWVTLLSLFTFMHWRRKWQPTPVFLPGESQGQGSLADCHLWGHTESDTTEATHQQQQQNTLWETLDWKKHKLESRLPGEISITSGMQITPPLWQKVKKNWRASDENEIGECKSWLKAQHSEN